MSNENDGTRVNLVYSPDISTSKSYLIKANKQFLQDLEDNDEIVIEGGPSELAVFNLNNNVYKIKGVNISTAMLVVDDSGTIFQCIWILMQRHVRI